MTGEITISLWLFIVLIAVAVIAVLDRVLIPSSRWFLRRRINRVIEEIGTRLDIEIRPFQLTKRQVLVDRLVYDPIVINAVRDYAREHDMPFEIVQDKVAVYAREIVPLLQRLFFTSGSATGSPRKSPACFTGLRVGLLQDEQYRAIDPASTVVFVMNHRSNMDYVLVAFLAAERTTLSYAVGEWARIWPLHMLFRFMGAFFVRRNSGNPLYRRILERYIHMATQEGVCQAVFLEGGLSRDGCLQAPKLGLMDYMLRRFDPAPGPGHCLHSGGDQLRPHDRRPQPVAQPGSGNEAAQHVVCLQDDNRFYPAQPRVDGSQPVAPLRLCLRQFRRALVDQGLLQSKENDIQPFDA